MAYASIVHVVAHHPARPTYTATSVPTDSQVNLLIDEAAAELDWVLVKGGYDVPLLSSVPSSVKAFFQKANAYGAITMIEAGAQQQHDLVTFRTMWEAAKNMIEQGELPGVERNAAQSMPRTDLTASASYFFYRDSMF